MEQPVIHPAELARRIDHTLLRPDATAPDVDRLCDECREFGFFAACVNPIWVLRCVSRLAGSGVVVASVAGFPLGASLPAVKAEEARRAADEGATEIDMVVNLGALISGDEAAVRSDIDAVVISTKRANPAALVKVILETRALNDARIAAGCRMCVSAGADFVKTSTGFHASGGATPEHVALLREHATGLRVKASGGIRDLRAALAMLRAGADRLGMSASVAVVRELAHASGNR